MDRFSDEPFYAPPLKVGGHIDLRSSVHPYEKVCVAGKPETIATTDLKLQGYIVQGVKLCTWVIIHPLLTLTELWALVL